MTWRTVVIRSRAKLDLKLNNLVIRKVDETMQVHLGEMAMLIIESTAVSLTAALLSELNKRKIKVIFCDEYRNPSSSLIPFYGSHDTSHKIQVQNNWSNEMKDAVWTEIISDKIHQQALLLEELELPQAHQLRHYRREITVGDITNREGHAAKVYFNALFGIDFTRGQDDVINAALNYGYTILNSASNREIVAHGYITQIGIHHHSIFNPYNLSSDLMEPFRVLVDRTILDLDCKEFGSEEKMTLVGMLNNYVVIDGRRQTVLNAIKIYCRSIFKALEDESLEHLRFYQYGV